MGRSTASTWEVLTLLATCPGCRSDKPEVRVRAAFETCRAAVEAGDARGATAALDPTFQGPDGMDKGMAQLFLMGTFRREKVGVTVVRNEVAVKGIEAVQDVDLILTGRSGGLIPHDASHHSFRLRWRKTGDDWKLAELQPFDDR